MSAIMGIYYPDGKAIALEHLEDMMEILVHRGSDNANIWHESSVGFGHRMLWTTPESLVEKLPFTSHNKDLVITAEARIDNRDELNCWLEIEESERSRITDSQSILMAYEKWGDACVEKLLGDFAFAIWDKPQQRLFCARDHFGVKPFYYYHSQQAFVFASEIKALFCVPEVPRKLNEVRVGDFLSSALYDKQITFYQDILRLPPAHTMKVSSAGIKIESYWSLNPKYELKLGSDEEYAAKFREIFAEAVRCRLRSAYPVGSMLSGGLDSSSITCMARKILSENDRSDLHTFSGIFDKVPKSDERFFMDAVTRTGKIEPHYIHADEVSPLVDIEKILWHQDEPFFAPNLYLNWKAYQQANPLGVRVVLDGFDGDNIVSHGFGYLRELGRAGRWLKLFSELKKVNQNFRGYTQNFEKSYWIKFLSYLEEYGIKPFVHKFKITRFIWYRYKNLSRKIKAKAEGNTVKASWTSCINKKFIDRIGLKQRRRALLKQRYGNSDTQRQEHYHAVNNGVLPTTLEVLDRTANASGIELRYPFWDKRLVEFCLSLPSEQKMNLGWTRMILRRSMEGILPKEIQWRGGKGNLGHSLRYGLQTFEKDNVKQMLELQNIENYLDLSYLNLICDRLISEDENDDIASIWKATNMSLWLKHIYQPEVKSDKQY